MNNIQTLNVQLYEITPKDIPHLHYIDSIPACDEFNTLGIPDSIEKTRKNYQSFLEDQTNSTRKFFAWVIKTIDGEKIGTAGFINSADRFKIGEIFYKIAPDFWGKGYGTEVSKALIRFGFETLKLHRIEAGVATGNKASIKVLEKSNMLREGLHKKILPIRGKWVDNYQYAIVEDEYFEAT